MSLGSYGYRDVLEALRKPGGDAAEAADVEGWVNVALAEPGPVVVHLLTHGERGRGQTVLYVLGPDGVRVQTSVNDWVNRAEGRRGDFGPVLFVLDVCHAGAIVGYQLQQLVDAGDQRVWVLTAASGADPAYDGRLTWALAQVLDRFRSGELRVDPSVRYIPLRRLFSEVDRLVRERSQGSYPQQIRSSYAPLHVDIDQLEFFPNPGWVGKDNDARDKVAELATQLDEAFDPLHFMRRAGAAEAIFGHVGRGFFRGRAEQLQELRGWVMGTGASLRVVTGKPGVGKSALLGVVVCAAHPALREPTRNLWDRLAHMPPPLPEGCLAVVHARRRRVTEIIASIARQWRLSAPGECGDCDGETWTGRELITALSQSTAGPDGAQARRLLVVDAVDETDKPGDLVAGVLSPLAAARREGGEPLCHILVASRDEAYLQPLIDATTADCGLIDLGAVPRLQLRDALTEYVKDLLRYGTPYERLPYASAADALAETIAGALTADLAPLRWGEFLVAGLYVRHVLDLPPVSDLVEARRLGEAVPHDLRGVLALELARPAPGLDVRVLQSVALALAFAEGSGMPERVTGHIATAFMPSRGYPAGLSDGETRKALDWLRFYLRRDADLDGTTLYRLFHQGLADQLRADEDATAAAQPGYAVQVWQHMYAMIPTGPDGSRQWQYAEPYLLRHAAQHATAAGRVDELLQDTGFLTYADPITLAPLIAALPAGAAEGAADTYRASFAAHSRQPPAGRAQILAVDAARYGNVDMAQRLSSAVFWQPIWASSQSRSARLRQTLTDHTGRVLSVAIGRAGDRDVIVSGSEDGAVRVWDAATGQPVGQPPTGHTGGVAAVAVGRAGNRDVIVSGSEDGAVRVWDAATGQPVGQPPTGHTGRVTAVAAGRAGNRDVIVSGSSHRTVRVWDTATGQPVGQPPTGHTGRVTAVAAGRAGNRDVIVSGSSHRTVRVWDTATGQPVSQPPTGHASWVLSLAVGRTGDREVIVSGGEEGMVRVWDAATGQPVGQPLTGHTGGVLAVAVGRAGDRDVIVSGGEEGMVLVWDAATGQPVGQPLTGHTGSVLAVAVGRAGDRDVIVSGSSDQTVRVWDAATRQPVGQPPTGHTGRVTAVAAGQAGDRDVIVSGSSDQTVRVWDAATGHPLGQPLTGHASWVLSVAVGRAGDRDVIVSGSSDRTVRVWDAATGHPLGQPLTGHASSVLAVAVGQAGDRDVIVSGSEEGMIRFWDAATGQPVGQPLTGHASSVLAVAVGRAGDRDVIVSGSSDQTVRVWDAATRQPVGQPLTGHTGRVTAVAAGRAGDRDVIVSGSSDQTVRVWDAATRQPVGQPLTGHTGSVLAVTVEDRAVIVSGGEDGTVRTWNMDTRLPVAQQQFPDDLRSLALIGERLVAAQGNDVVGLRVNPAIASVTGLSASLETEL